VAWRRATERLAQSSTLGSGRRATTRPYAAERLDLAPLSYAEEAAGGVVASRSIDGGGRGRVVDHQRRHPPVHAVGPCSPEREREGGGWHQREKEECEGEGGMGWDMERGGWHGEVE
jgi:hypothetical protein